jgi:hypothetical protein
VQCSVVCCGVVWRRGFSRCEVWRYLFLLTKRIHVAHMAIAAAERMPMTIPATSPSDSLDPTSTVQLVVMRNGINCMNQSMDEVKDKGKAKLLDGHLPLFDVSEVRLASLRSPAGPTGAFDTDCNDEVDGEVEGDGEEAEAVLCGDNGDAALGDNDDEVEVEVEEEGDGEEAEAVLCGDNGDAPLGDTDNDVEIEEEGEGREGEALVAGDNGDAGLGDNDDDGDFEIEGGIEV